MPPHNLPSYVEKIYFVKDSIWFLKHTWLLSSRTAYVNFTIKIGGFMELQVIWIHTCINLPVFEIVNAISGQIAASNWKGASVKMPFVPFFVQEQHNSFEHKLPFLFVFKMLIIAMATLLQTLCEPILLVFNLCRTGTKGTKWCRGWN